MNAREIRSGNSVGVTLCNEVQASLSQQTLLKVKEIRLPSQVAITTLESDRFSQNRWENIKNSVGWGTLGLVHIVNKENFEQSGLVSWRSPLKKNRHTGGQENTREHPTSKWEKEMKRMKFWVRRAQMKVELWHVKTAPPFLQSQGFLLSYATHTLRCRTVLPPTHTSPPGSHRLLFHLPPVALSVFCNELCLFAS